MLISHVHLWVITDLRLEMARRNHPGHVSPFTPPPADCPLYCNCSVVITADIFLLSFCLMMPLALR